MIAWAILRSMELIQSSAVVGLIIQIVLVQVSDITLVNLH